MKRRCGFLGIALVAALILSAARGLADGPVAVLHSFAGVAPDGAYPWATLIRGADGNFYGTTVAGGSFDAGTVFRVTPTGALTALYSFTNGLDGGNPRSALVLGSDGNFYGTAAYAGSNGVGTVFKMTTNGLLTPLYSFLTNGIDGQHPEAALIERANGNFYGTTYGGGSNGFGTVFAITPGGALTIQYSFTGERDGANPSAPLVVGTNGNFYGTAAHGGTLDQGTVFMITPEGVLTPLYSFTHQNDGALPWAALVLGTDGNFYGTTYNGGAYGHGTVFIITPSGELTPLYSFTNGKDGGQPYAALVQGTNGNFFGASSGGDFSLAGTNSFGAIFEITPGGDLTTLYSFTNGMDGATPIAALVLGTNGNFFGAAEVGGVIGWGGQFVQFPISPGTAGWGTIFTVTPDGDFASLCAFSGGSEGANSGAGLIQGTNGIFYGTTERGGSNDDGTVFQMTADGKLTTLYFFTAGSDGAVPTAALTQGSDGNFYGTTYGGGPTGDGTVFQITPAGALTSLHVFTNGSDGARPRAPLVQGTNGNFYGTTSSGGDKNGGGTIFQIDPAGLLTTLHIFTNGSDGSYSTTGLVQGANGAFYGTTLSGGTNGYGTAFEITAGGVLTPLYSFQNGADGFYPSALALGNDGNFYGVCGSGGTGGYGTVFKITPAGFLTALYSFTGSNDGWGPQSSLVQGSDGKFYGTTEYGGVSDYGTIFQITTNGALTTLYELNALNEGILPVAALVQGTNGNFYLTTSGGDEYNSGTVLRLTVPPVLLYMTAAGSGWSFGWSGETGQQYQAQYTSGLGATAWNNLGSPFNSVGPVVSATDPSPAGPQRFYRIVALP